jgi:CHAT domain
MSQSVHVNGNGNAVTTIGGSVVGPVSTPAGARWTARGATREVILFAAASPAGVSPLRLLEESREVSAALRTAREPGRFEFQPWTALRPRDFTAALFSLRPRIVHFAGHGEPDGTLCLEDDVGGVHSLSPVALEMLLASAGEWVECLVLNACWTDELAAQVARTVPYVVGMRAEVSDAAAIAFSTGFYLAVAAGVSIPSAFAAGCGQVAAMNLPEHLTPVLRKHDPAAAAG